MKTIEHNIENQRIIFDYRKFLFWEKESALILSDVHVGKITHFIKNGIPLPENSSFSNLKLLKSIISEYQPQKVFFLGDLFHSNYNSEWDEWLSFFKNTSLRFTLIKGNHDQLNHRIEQLNIYKEFFLPPFHFSHFPEFIDGKFNIHGHIHPAYKLTGKGKQVLKLPCFHICKNSLTLPSFGAFTGNHFVRLENTNDQIFILSKNQIFKIKS